MNTTKASLSCLSLLFWLLLSGTSISEAANVTFYVDGVAGINQISCGAQATPCKTISYTVNNKAQQNNNSEIKIAAGTYNESIVIDKKNIYLSGAGKNSTFIVGNNTTAAINAYGAYLRVANLSVNNGKPGILGSSVIMQIAGVIVNNNAGGIVVQSNSSLELQLGQVRSNTLHGISVIQNSSAKIGPTIVTGNSINGIHVDMSSSAIISNTTLTLNYQGIQLIAGSSATVQGSTISSNKQWGISVAGNASLRLGGGNTIKLNGDIKNLCCSGGVIIGQNSQATIQSDSGNTNMDQIRSNYGGGIRVVENSSLFMVDGVIDTNKAYGIALGYASGAQFQPGTTITNNAWWGLGCNGDSKYFGTLGTVSGNVQGQIGCQQY